MSNAKERTTLKKDLTKLRVADKDWVEKRGSFTYDGTQVFAAQMGGANTWQSLDLSSYVGSRRALCFFKVTASAAIAYCQSPDLTGTIIYHGNFAGPNQCYLISNADTGYMTMMTHSDGTITHGGNTAAPTVTLTLLGYAQGT